MAEATAGADETPAREKKEKKEKGEKKPRSPVLLVLLVAVVAVAAGGGGVYFLVAGEGSDKVQEKSKNVAAKTDEKSMEKGVLSLEPFIVNLADADVDRYVKCTVRLVVDTQAAAEKVKSQELAITRVRDRILTLLSGKKFLEVSTPEGKEALRVEIAAAVGEVLEAGKITAVYYTEFIVQ